MDALELEPRGKMVLALAREFGMVETAAQRDLATALRDLFAFVENGVLIRDISHDHEPGWAMRQVPLVQTLAAVKAILAKVTS